MKTVEQFSTYSNLGDAAKGAVIALGNFDGLHRGHQVVMAKAVTIAAGLNSPAAIGVFLPHPMRLFQPDSEPFRLMGSILRRTLLPEYGIERIYEIPFDANLRAMTDVDFVDIVLHHGLGARHMIVGEDFRFGKNRCGDFDSLNRLCTERGIGVTGVTPVGLHPIYGKYGSTEIRKALKAGDVFHAAHMLSRPWTVRGIVSKGEQRGRTINFPTANIAFGDIIRPKFGVYSVEMKIGDDPIWYPGVANTGQRPTVGGTEARIEVHLFDFDRDIYGQTVQVAFRTYLRAEQKFESFDHLKDQITKDARAARAVLGVGMPGNGP